MRSSDVLKNWIPPAMEGHLRQVMGRSVYFKGEFFDWAEAVANSTGYDAEIILKRVQKALLKVKAGNASYERDSVIFDHVQYPFPLLSALLRAAIESNGQLRVLDFGGSLGSSYFQCRSFLSGINDLHWGVIEQRHFVSCGRECFEDTQLRFFEDIVSCYEYIRPNVALLSSVLQYVREPFNILGELMQRDLSYIIIDRTPFSDSPADHLTVQHVPEKIYRASYPCWIFNRTNFLSRIHDNYEVIAEFESDDGQARAGSIRFTFGGMILRKRV